MIDISIPTIYCPFSDNYEKEDAFFLLSQHPLFDLFFSEKAIYSNDFGSVTDWVVCNIKEIESKNEDDLFIIM